MKKPKRNITLKSKEFDVQNPEFQEALIVVTEWLSSSPTTKQLLKQLPFKWVTVLVDPSNLQSESFVPVETLQQQILDIICTCRIISRDGKPKHDINFASKNWEIFKGAATAITYTGPNGEIINTYAALSDLNLIINFIFALSSRSKKVIDHFYKDNASLHLVLSFIGSRGLAIIIDNVLMCFRIDTRSNTPARDNFGMRFLETITDVNALINYLEKKNTKITLKDLIRCSLVIERLLVLDADLKSNLIVHNLLQQLQQQKPTLLSPKMQELLSLYNSMPVNDNNQHHFSNPIPTDPAYETQTGGHSYPIEYPHKKEQFSEDVPEATKPYEQPIEDSLSSIVSGPPTEPGAKYTLQSYPDHTSATNEEILSFYTETGLDEDRQQYHFPEQIYNFYPTRMPLTLFQPQTRREESQSINVANNNNDNLSTKKRKEIPQNLPLIEQLTAIIERAKQQKLAAVDSGNPYSALPTYQLSQAQRTFTVNPLYNQSQQNPLDSDDACIFYTHQSKPG